MWVSEDARRSKTIYIYINTYPTPKVSIVICTQGWSLLQNASKQGIKYIIQSLENSNFTRHHCNNIDLQHNVYVTFSIS